MVIRMMVAATLGFAVAVVSTAASAADVRPAPAVYSPSAAAAQAPVVPAAVRRHVSKRTDIAPGLTLIGVVVAGAAVGGIVAGTTGSNSATSQ